MGLAVGVGELRSGVEVGGVGVGGLWSGGLGSGELGSGVWGVGVGVEVGGVEVRVGKVGVGVSDRDITPAFLRPPPFSKLPTPTSLHTYGVKSSLRQIVLASSRLRIKFVRVKSSASNFPAPVKKCFLVELVKRYSNVSDLVLF